MEQNNYLEFEKSKVAVYTIMEACFQDVFDLEDDELGSFHDEIDEYMNQNQKGSWLPENQMITDRFYEWLFEELPYFYVGLLIRPVLVNWLFKVMYESEKKNNKMQAYEVNPEFVDRSFPTEKSAVHEVDFIKYDGVYKVDFTKYDEELYHTFADKISEGLHRIQPLNSVLSVCCGTMSDQYKIMIRFIVGHFLELLFLLMHDLEVYIMLANHLANIQIEINCMLDPFGCEEPPEWEE